MTTEDSLPWRRQQSMESLEICLRGSIPTHPGRSFPFCTADLFTIPKTEPAETHTFSKTMAAFSIQMEQARTLRRRLRRVLEGTARTSFTWPGDKIIEKTPTAPKKKKHQSIPQMEDPIRIHSCRNLGKTETHNFSRVPSMWWRLIPGIWGWTAFRQLTVLKLMFWTQIYTELSSLTTNTTSKPMPAMTKTMDPSRVLTSS